MSLQEQPLRVATRVNGGGQTSQSGQKYIYVQDQYIQSMNASNNLLSVLSNIGALVIWFRIRI